MIVRTPDGRATAFDYREKAPGKATPTMYLGADGNIDRSLTARGYLAPDPRIWFDVAERQGDGAPWTLEPDDWDRWDRFFHSKTEYTDWKDLGDRVTATGHETNDFYRLTDWTPNPLGFTWWFDREGRISGFQFHAVEKGKAPSRFEDLKAWARANRPDELAYLMPKDRIDPSGDRPVRWRRLATEWRKAAGLPEVTLQ